MDKVIIKEEDIDTVYVQLAMDPEGGVKVMSDFAESQPHVAAWLLGDGFDVLTEDEQDYMFFLATSVYLAVKSKVEQMPVLDGESLRNAEERNWSLLEGVKAKSFQDRITVLFEDSDQEDLLAFVEDSLAEDDVFQDDVTTPVGREPIFVAMKSLIDAMPML